MASNSKIGALHVSLGLNTAQFEAGLKKSQMALAGFGKIAGTAFKAAAAGAALAAGAMGYAVKGAIDHADALSKSAQKAGVTTEALSRLAYAADYSDVSLESLTGGLQKLSKAMADAVINKTSASATAFKALGIEITDANGKLRGSDEVFADISDRFARMENGATKTALAMQIFGRSGAEMIPLLNSGGAELKRMADEADRLGITLSTKTGKDAERFNDTLNLIGKVLQGVVNQVMGAALPSLQALAQTLADPAFASWVTGFAKIAIDLLNSIAAGAANAANNIRMLRDVVSGLDQMSSEGLSGRLTQIGAQKLTLDNRIATTQTRLDRGDDLFGINRGALESQITEARNQIAELVKEEQKILAVLAGRESASGAASAPVAVGAVFEPIITGAAKAKEAIEITIPPLSEMQQAIADIGATFDNAVSSAMSGLISDLIKGENAFDNLISKAGQFGDRLISMAMDSAIQGLFGTIAGLFGGGLGLGGGGIGRATYGGVGGFFPAFPGYEGGGYTGMGARSGGMDGKSGFLAMLHPDETVLDHTKGQGSGVVMNFNITGSRQDATEIANVARGEAEKVLMRYQQNDLRKG